MRISEKTRSKGRPRDQTVDRKILQTALGLVKKHGVKAVTLEMIAETSGVARTTIYRRWRNRSAILADAFLTNVEPRIHFPEHTSSKERLRQQMHLLAKSFRGSTGTTLRALLSEALFDEEFRVAIRDRWIAPRRTTARSVVQEAIDAGELDAQTSPDLLLDALYGALYYWLLFDPRRLSDAYVDSIFELVLREGSVKTLQKSGLSLSSTRTTTNKLIGSSRS